MATACPAAMSSKPSSRVSKSGPSGAPRPSGRGSVRQKAFQAGWQSRSFGMGSSAHGLLLLRRHDAWFASCDMERALDTRRVDAKEDVARHELSRTRAAEAFYGPVPETVLVVRVDVMQWHARLLVNGHIRGPFGCGFDYAVILGGVAVP
jgi:hypothetical protein